MGGACIGAEKIISIISVSLQTIVGCPSSHADIRPFRHDYQLSGGFNINM
jgi:hypothetical protein